MVEALKGHRELFRGLWIYDSDYEFVERPIIRLSLNYLDSQPEGALEANLTKSFLKIGTQYHVPVNGFNIDTTFESLVEELSKKFQFQGKEKPKPGEIYDPVNNVVILIDDCDAPILKSWVHDQDLAQKNHKTLHDFFSKFKDLDRYIYFSLVTGVTQAANVALGANTSNLVDISLDPEFAGICGFTADDLRNLFGDHFAELLASLKLLGQMEAAASAFDLEAKIFNWRGGYNFDGEPLPMYAPKILASSKPSANPECPELPLRVLNPYSVVNLFTDHEFNNFWLRKEPSTFLAHLMAKSPLNFLEAPDAEYSESTLATLSLDSLDPVSLLFQFGFLTIDQVKPAKGDNLRRFSLKIPNFEARAAYQELFLGHIFKIDPQKEKSAFKEKLSAAFLEADSLKIGEILASVLSRLTYLENSQNEKPYHAALRLFFLVLGLDVRSEPPSAWGHLDLVLALDNNFFVCLEFKYATWSTVKLAPPLSGQSSSTGPNLLDVLLTDPRLSLLSSIQKDYLISLISKDQPIDSVQLIALIGQFSRPKYLSPDSVSEEKPPKSLIPFEILAQTAQKALDQIQAKDYANQYRLLAKNIVEIGLAVGGRNQVKAIARKFKGSG
jgi:hypothetical protein